MLQTAAARPCPACHGRTPAVTPRGIGFRPARASLLLGVDVPADFCRQTLTDLGCTLTATDPHGVIAVIPPSYRLDLEREADLIEEVGRVYGLDRIPPKLPKVSKSLTESHELTEFGFLAQIKAFAAGAGLHEAVIYSFVGQADLDLLGIDPACRVCVANPLSEDQNVMRPMLAPGLLLTVRHNLAQGNANLRLFEAARVYAADPASPTTAREASRFGLVLHGSRHPEGWPWPKDGKSATPIARDWSNTSCAVAPARRHLHPGRQPALAGPPGGRPGGRRPTGLFGPSRARSGRRLPCPLGTVAGRTRCDALRQLVAARQPSFTPCRASAGAPGHHPGRTADRFGGRLLDTIRGASPAIFEDVLLLDAYKPQKTPPTAGSPSRITYRPPGKELEGQGSRQGATKPAPGRRGQLPVARLVGGANDRAEPRRTGTLPGGIIPSRTIRNGDGLARRHRQMRTDRRSRDSKGQRPLAAGGISPLPLAHEPRPVSRSRTPRNCSAESSPSRRPDRRPCRGRRFRR